MGYLGINVDSKGPLFGLDISHARYRGEGEVVIR